MVDVVFTSKSILNQVEQPIFMPVSILMASSDVEEEDYTDLNIIGNLTAKQAFKINTTSSISNIGVRIFRRNRWDESALPGTVSLNYTWKEMK